MIVHGLVECLFRYALEVRVYGEQQRVAGNRKIYDRLHTRSRNAAGVPKITPHAGFAPQDPVERPFDATEGLVIRGEAAGYVAGYGAERPDTPADRINADPRKAEPFDREAGVDVHRQPYQFVPRVRFGKPAGQVLGVNVGYSGQGRGRALEVLHEAGVGPQAVGRQ